MSERGILFKSERFGWLRYDFMDMKYYKVNREYEEIDYEQLPVEEKLFLDGELKEHMRVYIMSNMGEQGAA